VNGAAATIEVPAATFALESTEGIMTAATASPVNPAAVLDDALNALDALCR
jgi:hypothetical protein